MKTQEIKNNMDMIAANYVKQLLVDYNNVVESDCIGDMLVFMDEFDYPYAHLINNGMSDEEDNDAIRRCCKVAYFEYIGSIGTRMRSIAKKEMFDC